MEKEGTQVLRVVQWVEDGMQVLRVVQWVEDGTQVLRVVRWVEDGMQVLRVVRWVEEGTQVLRVVQWVEENPMGEKILKKQVEWLLWHHSQKQKNHLRPLLSQRRGRGGLTKKVRPHNDVVSMETPPLRVGLTKKVRPLFYPIVAKKP